MPAEVLVLGGGPAGASAAILLARAGRRVTLLERTRGPADKVCGEFLSVEALGSLAAFGIDLEALGAPSLTRLRLVGRGLPAEAELPFAARSLSRRVLDEVLLRLAEQAGAEVRRGAQVDRLEQDGQGWCAHLADGVRCQAPQVFAAPGKHDLRGYPRGRGLQSGLVAFKLYLRLAGPQQQALAGAIELVLFAGGYAGLQPVSAQAANLCLLIEARRLRHLGSGWESLRAHMEQASPHLAQRLDGAEPLLDRPLALSSIPYGYLRRRTQPGLWWLGDQAAVIPSFSGDGMSIALHSAGVAAEMYLAGHSSDHYQRLLARQLAGQMLRATVISQLLVRAPRLALLARAWPAMMPRLAVATRVQSPAQANPS